MTSQEPTQAGGQTPASNSQSGQQQAAPAAIDLQALADRVLRLLKEEARLERERRGQRYRP